MRKSFNTKALLTVLSVIAASGVVKAENGYVKIESPNAFQVPILIDLIDRGILVRLLEYPDWYQINSEVLDEALKSDAKARVRNTIENLRELVGNEVKIEDVDLGGAHLATQVFGGAY